MSIDLTGKSPVYQGPLRFLVSEDKWTDKYYYVISGDGKKLKGYKNASMSTRVGGQFRELDISRLTDPYDISTANDLNDIHISAFSILLEKRTVYLASPTGLSRQGWIDILQTIIRSRTEKNMVLSLAAKLRVDEVPDDVLFAQVAAQKADKIVEDCEAMNLRLLDWSGLGLLSIPVMNGGVLHRRIPKVRGIDFSNNGFSELPADLLRLKYLRVVRLTACKFTQFPQSLVEMKLLEELYLGENQLTAIPCAIGYMVKLETLSLERNHISVVDPAIACLSELSDLNLSENVELTSLPSTFGELRELQYLDLSQCSFSLFPPNLLALDGLLEFDISRNKLIQLPKEMGRLENMTSFNCAGNALMLLPPSLGLCARLRSPEGSLDISRNPFEDSQLTAALYEGGGDAVLDYLEEAMIAAYGAFPTYELFPRKPQRTMSGLRGETQVSYGISPQIKQQMALSQMRGNSQSPPQRASPSHLGGVQQRRGRSGSLRVDGSPRVVARMSDRPPGRPQLVGARGRTPGGSSRGNSPSSLKSRAVPSPSPSRTIQQFRPSTPPAGTSRTIQQFRPSTPPAGAYGSTTPPILAEKNFLSPGSSNESAGQLQKLISSLPAGKRSGSFNEGALPGFRSEVQSNNVAELSRMISAVEPPLSSSPSAALESVPNVTPVGQVVPGISPSVAPAPPFQEEKSSAPPTRPVLSPELRMAKVEWADSTLEIVEMKLTDKVDSLDAVTNVSELAGFIQLSRTFTTQVLPKLNNFITISTSTPPPNDDKFIRAKSIVKSGLTDSLNAVERLRQYLHTESVHLADFFAALVVVDEIKSAV